MGESAVVPQHSPTWSWREEGAAGRVAPPHHSVHGQFKRGSQCPPPSATQGYTNPPPSPLPAVTGDQRTPRHSFPFSSLDSWAEGFAVGQGTAGLGACRRAQGADVPGGGGEGPPTRCVLTGTQRVGHRDTPRLPDLRQLWGRGSQGQRTSPVPHVPHMGPILSLQVHLGCLVASEQANSQMPLPPLPCLLC